MAKKNKDIEPRLGNAIMNNEGTVILNPTINEKEAETKLNNSNQNKELNKYNNECDLTQSDIDDGYMSEPEVVELANYNFCCYGCYALKWGRAFICSLTGKMYGTCCADGIVIRDKEKKYVENYEFYSKEGVLEDYCDAMVINTKLKTSKNKTE